MFALHTYILYFLESYASRPASERRRSSLVTDIVNADKSVVNQRRRQSISERKPSLASDVRITSPEQAAMNARKMSWTPSKVAVGCHTELVFTLE